MPVKAWAEPPLPPPLVGFDGYISDLAIWEGNLTQQEMLALHSGAHPGTVRPEKLQAHYHVISQVALPYSESPRTYHAWVHHPGGQYAPVWGHI